MNKLSRNKLMLLVLAGGVIIYLFLLVAWPIMAGGWYANFGICGTRRELVMGAAYCIPGLVVAWLLLMIWIKKGAENNEISDISG